MTPEPDEVALFERNAGLVIPEESVAAHLALAARAGADLHHEEPVTSWRSRPRRRGRGQHAGGPVPGGPAGHLPRPLGAGAAG